MSGQTSTADQTVNHEASTDGIQLMENESVLENRRPGWSLWWKQIGLAILVLFGGLGGDAAATGLVGSALIFGYVVLSRSRSRYVVTDERIKGKVGLLSSSSMEYRIADLRSIATSQSVFEKMLGHGSLEFQAGANNQLVWHGVPDYEAVATTVRERQRKFER